MPTRRQTLLGLAAALLPSAPARADAAHALAPWTGDDFAAMHAIRDGRWSGPLPTPERRVELVVVGAGLAGLATAALLDDLDLLVLEREEEIGGAAKSGSWRGVDYALGSAYFVEVGEPFGPFYDRLGLKPRPLREPVDGLFPEALQKELRAPLAALRKRLTALADSADFPPIPIETATARAMALDGLSLWEFLKSEGVDPVLLPLIDAYCLSSLGAGADAVSAYAGVNFLADMTGPIYAFPGGNAVISRAMAARATRGGAGRIVSGAAVFAIEPSEGGLSRVGWFDARAGGPARCVAAKWVVVAAPFFFAARILRGLAKETRAAMAGLRQGAYLVANCCFEGTLATQSYDAWAPGAEAFADVVDASWAAPQARPKTHGVLTVYAPFRDPARGRALLLAGEQAALAAPIAADLKRLLPEVVGDARLVEMRLTRWGHHNPIPAPGAIGQRRALPRRFGGLLLAHSDGQGLPAVESALTEAFRAAAIVRGG